MIEIIQDLPKSVVGLKAIGEVNNSDYESIIFPYINESLKYSNKIRLLYHIGPEFKKFTSGAIWDDTKMGFKYFSMWERIAIVSDVNWVQRSIKFLSFIVHGHVKLFSNNELDDAIRWITDGNHSMKKDTPNLIIQVEPVN